MKSVIRYIALTVALLVVAVATGSVAQAQMSEHRQKAPAAASKGAARHALKATSTAKVNINTGTTEQFATLPGIGPSAAKKIVDFRSKSGPFKRLEDLMAVKGIGEKKFLKLKDRLGL